MIRNDSLIPQPQAQRTHRHKGSGFVDDRDRREGGWEEFQGRDADRVRGRSRICVANEINSNTTSTRPCVNSPSSPFAAEHAAHPAWRGSAGDASPSCAAFAVPVSGSSSAAFTPLRPRRPRSILPIEYSPRTTPPTWHECHDWDLKARRTPGPCRASSRCHTPKQL